VFTATLIGSNSTPTPLAAVLDLVPVLFPFLSPGKGPAAGEANLGGQMLFFDSFHRLEKVFINLGSSRFQ
jgi:hypothetical protein